MEENEKKTDSETKEHKLIRNEYVRIRREEM